jgi:hypothetical protein
MRLMTRLRAVLHRADERERAALTRHHAALARAAKTLPGDETLRKLLEEADKLLRDEVPR